MNGVSSDRIARDLTASGPGSDSAALLRQLGKAVGARHVLTGMRATARYRQGFRFGEGSALAVVRPQSLVAFWRVLQACVAARAVVIVQAANTGLTGGSTPFGEDYDRPVVIVSPIAIDGVHLLDEGRQALCLPGTTLNRLEAMLRPLGREPHSVIGSSCLGASVMGGICNNSGGALVRRGPAYTELALYARLGEDGTLHLVNHLGIRLPDDPEAALAAVEQGGFVPADVDLAADARASDRDYARRVREVDASTPARFNADPGRLFEASGCAGKLALFAVRLDTFAQDGATRTFYLGTNDQAEFAALRRRLLVELEHLPVSAEYMHRDCFDIADRYGKDMFLAIRALGTDRLPLLNRIKARVDRMGGALRLGAGLSDRLLQLTGRLLPGHLPARMRAFRDRFEHHLILKVAGEGIAETEALLREIFPSTTGDMFVCTQDEAAKAMLHRFVAAGAAVRYRAVHPKEVGDIVALDVALPRNATNWLEPLPPELAAQMRHQLHYGHFLCHVFHHDYIVRRGTDPVALKHALCALLDARGAEYPAEHNVGHLYAAKSALANHYRNLDPCNAFNPGIGQLSKRANWEPAPAGDLAR